MFFGLHRTEILEKPMYQRLIIGAIEGETSDFHSAVPGSLSKVPYAEPTWLSDGYYSPYYTKVRRDVSVLPTLSDAMTESP